MPMRSCKIGRFLKRTTISFFAFLFLASLGIAVIFNRQNDTIISYPENLRSKVCERELARFNEKFKEGEISLVMRLKIAQKLIIEKCEPNNYLLANYFTRIILQAERFERGEISYKEYKRFRDLEWKKYGRKTIIRY